jgi:hypothetical protein
MSRYLALLLLLAPTSACFLDAVGLPPPPEGEGGSAAPEDGGSAPLGGDPQGAGTSMGGAGGAAATCGNGLVETSEGCDSGAASVGCVECQVTAGYACIGEPSLCSMIDPVTVSAEFDVAITDVVDHYDGSVESMDCADIEMPEAGFSKIQWVTLEVAVDHDWLGDLVIKLVPPGELPPATVLSRAAADEPVDDYLFIPSEGSHIRAAAPVTFDDTAEVDAEMLGSTINGGVVCMDDNVCVVRSNPGAAIGDGLVDLVGLSPVGTWRVCFADGDEGAAGSAKGARLTVLAW